MKRSTKKVLAGLALATVFGFSAQQTDAALIVELENGASTVTVTDNGVGDSDPTLGSVTYVGSVGVFDINVTTGISKPLVGSATEPILTLNSVNTSSTAAGTLKVRMTATDFTGPVGAGLAAPLDFGGTTNGTAALDAYVDSSNAAFGMATPAGSLGAFGPGPFDDSSASIVSATGPYSATLEATIVHAAPLDITSFGGQLRVVPEPGSLALIGLGALLVGRRRRRG